MRASSFKQPLADNLAWWLTAFIFMVLGLTAAIGGGSLIGEWSNTAVRSSVVSTDR